MVSHCSVLLIKVVEQTRHRTEQGLTLRLKTGHRNTLAECEHRA